MIGKTKTAELETPVGVDAETYFNFLGSMPSIIETRSAGKNMPFSEGLAVFMSKILAATNAGKKIIFVGNGGSASIASHMAIDYSKNGGIRAICFNDPAQLTCLANDCGYENVFSRSIEIQADPGDLVVAISSSGRSANILNAVEAAHKRKCLVVTLSGFIDSNPLRELGGLNFYVPSNEYGFVEITHLAICHAALDFICRSKAERGKALP